MGKSSGPRMPDPVATADQQMGFNREAAEQSAMMNQITQSSPWGHSYWTGDIGQPNRAQHTALSPQLGRILFGGGYDSGPSLEEILASAGAASNQPAPVEEAMATPTAAPKPRRPEGYDDGESGPEPTWKYDSPMDFAREVRDFGRDAVSGFQDAWRGDPEPPSVPSPPSIPSRNNLPPYQMGGYTGMGDDGMLQPDKPAGVVHEGEYVIPAGGLAAVLGGAMPRKPMMNGGLAHMMSSGR